ncbi:ATP-dependent DNA helicase [Haloquadratum walsbyi]|uniref:Rad3-related DNA helicase n=1 Tax=Haloquadratum walsbyi J07HQW2 TaxID=1238425 RepID=U1PU67_9EURY|nr:MAG: Rad3-related DNA helicase [Haloquadratum walsbyi J07HQW2]
MSTTGDYERFFPYEEPYPNQRSAMGEIAEALDEQRDVLLEGAPGTGKTLSALCPAVEYARRTDKTVVITTNVHQQMRQFVSDARAIVHNDVDSIRAVVFKGKSSMCHIDVDYQECQTLRDTTRSLVDKERERTQLREQATALLDEIREGDDGAASARTAVTDELESVTSEIEDLSAGNICEYYHNNLTETDSTDAFFEWLFDDVRTAEEVYEYADERQLCGYELLKEGIEGVDLVICNYHHLLDPAIREQFFRWLGRDPDDIVAVFDEAHNIESAARDHAGRTLTENTLEEALTEINDCEDSRAEPATNVFEAFLTALRRTSDDSFGFGEREQVTSEWYDLTITNTDRRDDLTLEFLKQYEGRGINTEIDLARQLAESIDSQHETAYKNGETATRKECQSLQAASFLDAWMTDNDTVDTHPIISVRRDEGTNEVYARAELYRCIPRSVTADLFDEVHSSVLMSATLRPFDVAEDVLGLSDPVQMAYDLAYPEDNRRTLAIKTPALFSSARNDSDTQRIIADTLADAARFTPGNALFFFPSYAEAERYATQLRQHDAVFKPVMLDESGTETEPLRQSFVDHSGSVLCTSLWGTLAEGVSFDDDDARTVAVVGVPYPHLSERAEAVQNAYDRAYSGQKNAGWQYGIEIPTIRKTRQALGRVIRSPSDYGVRLLIDKRYTQESAEMGKYGVRGQFPPEERAELIDVDPSKVQFALLNFYDDLDAYDGAVPSPSP